MRKRVTITTSGIYVVDAVGAVTSKLVEGSVVDLPEPAADRLIERGCAVEVVEEPVEESPRARRRAKHATPADDTGETSDAVGSPAEPSE